MSIKSLGKQSLIYGVGHILARIVTFLLLPLYTHSFSQEEYGAISLAYAFMGFALILYRYGMDTALMKFSVQTEGENRTTHITVIILAQLVTSILFSGLLYIFRDPLAPFVLGTPRPEWMTYLAAILFLDAMWNLPQLLLRSEEKPLPFIGFSLLNVITTMGLNIVFVVNWGYGIEGVFFANIIASGLVFVLTLPVVMTRVKIQSFNKNVFQKVLKFALPFLPAGIFTMIMELSDRYLLEWFLGTADVGLYSAGKKLGTLGLTVIMGFNMGWTPYFLKRGQSPGAKEDFAKVTSYFLGAMGFSCFIVTIWIQEIMQLSIGGNTLIGSEFWGCEPIVGAILFGYFFFGVYVIQLPGVYIKEMTNWIPIFRVVGAITLLIAGSIMIPKIGIMGAAYAVVIAFIAMSFSIFSKTYSHYSVPYNWLAILFPIISLGLLQVGLQGTVSNWVLTGLYPVVWFFIILNKDEQKSLVSLIK